MGGDFNTILNNVEKRGRTMARHLFRDIIEDIIDSCPKIVPTNQLKFQFVDHSSRKMKIVV